MAFRLEIWLFPIRLPEAVKVRGRSGGIFEQSEESVEAKVYERMISERQRIAQKIRSVGLGEQAKIQGKIAKDLQEIESRAYRDVQSLKGNAYWATWTGVTIVSTG